MVVCGFGRVGRILAADLVQSNTQFVVIDTNQERLQEAENDGLFVLVGDATEEHVLESARVSQARVLATVLPDDAANVFITLTARELNADLEIIARAQSPSTEKKLLRSGATRVVLPAAIGATRIARLITRPSAEKLLTDSLQQDALAEDLEQFGLRLTELTICAESDCVGQQLSQLTLGDAVQFVILAIRSADGDVTRAPGSDYAVAAGDVIILLAHQHTEFRLHRTHTSQGIIYRGARS